jgi:hypothetical protein
VQLKRNKDSFDARLSELNRSFDTHLGVADLMTSVWLEPASFVGVVDVLSGEGEFSGRFAPFGQNPKLTAKSLQSYFKALGEVLDDSPQEVWGKTTVNDTVRAAFRHYTTCELTAKAVLGKLISPAIAADAIRTVKDRAARTGSLHGIVTYKRGSLKAADVAAFPVPSKEAVILINGLDHIFVVAQTDKCRIYQAFQNRYTISQSGMGNAPIDDLRTFLTDITSSKAVDWFGAKADHDEWSYLILQ